MKKINLKNLSIDEILSKDDLKKIKGGNGSGVEGEWPMVILCTCYTSDGPYWSYHTAWSVQDVNDINDSMSGCDSFSCTPIT